MTVAYCKQCALWCAGVALAVAMPGCRLPDFVSARLPHRPHRETPPYNMAHFVYEMDGRFRTIPLDDDRLTQAAYEAGPLVGDKRSERWTVARLTIHYPHPDGVPNLARATLRLSGRHRDGLAASPAALDEPGLIDDSDESSPRPAHVSPACDDEIWVLDVPRQQVDELIDELKRAGYFTPQQRTQPGTQLEVEVDRVHSVKAWTPEPRLDDFVSRVRNEGTLMGFTSDRLAAAKN